MAVRVKIEGLREVKDALRKLPNATAKNVMRRILKKRAKPFLEVAQELVPVDEGDLKESLAISTKLSRRQKGKHQKPDPHDVEVFIGAGTHPQAHMQEFGTSELPAQPYLRPAWDRKHKGALEGIKDDLWAEIKKAADRAARKAAKLAAKAGK